MFDFLKNHIIGMKIRCLIGARDPFNDTAFYLREVIVKAFEETPTPHWPPTSEDLVLNHQLPEELVRFISVVLSGSVVNRSDAAERLGMSIGQDVCRAVTNGD